MSVTVSLPAITHLHLRELFKLRGSVGVSALFSDLIQRTLPSRAGIQKLGNFENAFNQGFAISADDLDRLDRLAASPTLMFLLSGHKGKTYAVLKPNRSRTLAALIASAYVAECDHAAAEAEECRLAGLSNAERAASVRRVEAQIAERQALATDQADAAAAQLHADMAAALAEALK